MPTNKHNKTGGTESAETHLKVGKDRILLTTNQGCPEALGGQRRGKEQAPWVARDGGGMEENNTKPYSADSGGSQARTVGSVARDRPAQVAFGKELHCN